MTNSDLAKDYITRAGFRLKAIEVLFDNAAYPDVICECQEVMELTLKGYLRSLKIDPPKWHDVSSLLNENKEKLSFEVQAHLKKITEISIYLRKERENAFYGDDDLIPLSSYSKAEAESIKNETHLIYEIIQKALAEKNDFFKFSKCYKKLVSAHCKK